MNRSAFAAMGGAVLLAGCAAATPLHRSRAPAPATTPATRTDMIASSQTLPPAVQYLYGSGEAAAISEQAYNALVDAVERRLAGDRAGATRPADRASAVLAPDATIADPHTLPCGDRPPAVVFDIDETLLLNLGFEYDEARHAGRPYDERRWTTWEKAGVDKVVPVPGAADALRALRRMGVTVVFNSNRAAATAAFTEAALDHAGLGPARHGDTLWLRGDLDSDTGKDSRRRAIAARYCVVAAAGDQLGDFSDLFTGAPDERRAATASPHIRDMWGRVWFVLPNPVYGTGLKGDLDAIFPVRTRWSSPATLEK